MRRDAGVAQVVERLICNQLVRGSSPFASSMTNGVWGDGHEGDGEVPEWTKGTDCKSVAVRLRRFESSPPHVPVAKDCDAVSGQRGNSSVGRAPAFQAGGRGFESRFPLDDEVRLTTRSGRDERTMNGRVQALVAQLVEHILGKDEVTGSIPVKGSMTLMWHERFRVLDLAFGGDRP